MTAAVTTYTATCPTCNEAISGPTQAQANRNLGLHRRSKHGYKSPEYAEARKYRLTLKARFPGVAASQLQKAAVRERRKTLSPERYQQLFEARQARWGKAPAIQNETPREKALRMKREYNKKYRQVNLTRVRQMRRDYYQNVVKRKAQGLKPLPYGSLNQEPINPTNSSVSAAEPCKLSECPECGARFYVVKGGTQSTQ